MSTVCSYGRPLIAWTIVAKILHHTIQYSWDIEYIETHVCTVLRKVSGWSWGGVTKTDPEWRANHTGQPCWGRICERFSGI